MLVKHLILGTFIVVVTVTLHGFALLSMAKVLRFIDNEHSRRFHPWLNNMQVLIVAMLGIIFSHSIQIWIWAFVYLQLGEFTSLISALYFSATTLTTLGYGDITLSETWQLLSTFEAMGGLIVFGASTAFLIGAMRRLFDHD